jgi:hypothetical protein
VLGAEFINQVNASTPTPRIKFRISEHLDMLAAMETAVKQCGLPQLRVEKWFLLWVVILSNINVS